MTPSHVYVHVFLYLHKHETIFQIRQTKDAKLSSNSEGGNCFFIRLCGRRSFVLFYTSSCLRILEQHNFHYQFIVSQSPFITHEFPKFPSSPMNHIHRLYTVSSSSTHFNSLLLLKMFLSRTILHMPITFPPVLNCLSLLMMLTKKVKTFKSCGWCFFCRKKSS